jgi:acyl-CoA synthetase (AMP-forming)/AMP-acid ligase II
MLLFNSLYKVAEKNPNNLAINNWTYSDVMKKIDDADYSLICQSEDENILIDIFKASKIQKPLIILPKFQKDKIEITDIDTNQFNLYLFSSGTSSDIRKTIRLPESMILKNAEVAQLCQKITPDDKILTVCSLHHTGGLNAQTLPGLMIGAHIIIKKFNAYTFLKDLEECDISLTHLIPVMNTALSNTRTKLVPSKLRLVVSGSDCVSKSHATFWLDKNINFMVNYGMTEAGPMVINHEFRKGDKLDIFDIGVPLGTNCWCDYNIDDTELFLNGDLIHVQSWLATGDCVSRHGSWFVYHGRKSAGCKILPKKY